MKQNAPTHSFALIGFGREGQSSLRFLSSEHPEATFYIFDDKNREKLPENAQTLLKNAKNTHFFNKKDDFFEKLAQDRGNAPLLVVKSPGVPPSHPIIAELATHSEINHTSTSNSELFFEELTKLQPKNDGRIKVIGITGTKGKSTTTALIHHTLVTGHLHALLGGNIGVPALDLLGDIRNWSSEQAEQAARGHSIAGAALFVVLELSSHQLSDLTHSPHIAVIQNIVPEHLDYYKDFESYVAAKSHITRYQKSSDLVIYNSDYPQSTQLAELSAGRHSSFTTTSARETIERIVPLGEISLKGAHNLLNMMPSVIIAKELGLSTKILLEAFKTFAPLPHRMQLAATADGIKYYNDSLSTTPESAIAAIESFESGKVILLAGGYDRNLDYAKLASAIIKNKVKALILFPTTGKRIEATLKQVFDTMEKNVARELPKVWHVSSMRDGVNQAKSVAKSGDVVLLSPASASFNMYKDYAERGEAFEEAVGSWE